MNTRVKINDVEVEEKVMDESLVFTANRTGTGESPGVCDTLKLPVCVYVCVCV